MSFGSGIEKYPYFDGTHLIELREEALNEYLRTLIDAFLYSCKFTYESTDRTVLEAINSAVVHLINAIESRTIRVQLFSLPKTLSDLYNVAHSKLIKNGLAENAENLERLKQSIFHGWIPIYR